jgi:hypothetical protein
MTKIKDLKYNINKNKKCKKSNHLAREELTS